MRVASPGKPFVRSPLAWILLAVFVVHVIGIGWGLPASDGWDNDGVAPHDFLAGIVETFSPGSFYTYPPVHLVLLGVLTSPVTIVALVKAKSLAPPDVIHEILKVPYMTTIAFIARAVSVAMSLGIVYAVAKIAEELGGRRAAYCAGAVCGVNAVLTYYAHTSNLDVPYLFWAMLALLALVRAIARREPRRLRTFVKLAVLAVGTKDQAYALFLLTAPAALLLWAWLDEWPRKNARAIWKESAISVAIGVALLAFVDAVIMNPTGFRARLRFLLGSASQDFAHYSNDTKGRLLVLRDSFAAFDRYYPWVFALLVVFGLAMVWSRGKHQEGAKRAASLVPLLSIVSFTLLFNCTARRTEHRFLLPQMCLVAVYAGVALEALLFDIQGRRRAQLARAMASVGFALAIFKCLDVDANLVLDPRYDAEAWLAANIADGDTIEVHGLNVYLPRFPAKARVVRVGPEPARRRNPLPDVEEKEDAFSHIAERSPRWIVVSEGWVWRYLLDPHATDVSGRVLPPTQIENGSDRDATWFFQGLVREERGYALAHKSVWSSQVWPRLDFHASTSREIWIYERRSIER